MNWRLMNGDDKLRAEIKRVQDDFDLWFERYHSRTTTREKMLSDNSPVPHVAHKMTKSFDWLKEKYPYESVEDCKCCGKTVTTWIQAEFSFCNEYGCGMSLCEQCVENMSKLFK